MLACLSAPRRGARLRLGERAEGALAAAAVMPVGVLAHPVPQAKAHAPAEERKRTDEAQSSDEAHDRVHGVVLAQNASIWGCTSPWGAGNWAGKYPWR